MTKTFEIELFLDGCNTKFRADFKAGCFAVQTVEINDSLRQLDEIDISLALHKKIEELIKETVTVKVTEI